MKKKSMLVLSPLVAFVLYITLTSYSGGISGVSTGGCSCHDPSPSPTTIVSLTGLPSGGYVNGTVYTLTLTVTNTSVIGPNPRDGFDLTASDGIFTPTIGTVTNGDQELHHDTPQVTVAGTATWSFDWTAPTTGNAAVTFDVAANATNGDGSSGAGDFWNSYSTTIIGTGPPSTILSLKLFLEGYFIGSSQMTPALYNQGISSDPFVTDSITVELKDIVNYTTSFAIKAELQIDGTIEFDLGTLSGSYYIVVTHRNGVQTWSAMPISIGPGTNVYDFTTASNQAYGDNMQEVEPGIWAFHVGDLNQDENVDLLDIGAVELDISNFEFGYFSTDLNGDGNVDLLDTPIVENNISNFVFSNHP